MSSTPGNTCPAALQITNLHPVVSPVQAGKVLCDSLGRAEDASVLRFGIDSNEVGGLPHSLSVRHLAYQVAKLTPMKNLWTSRDGLLGRTLLLQYFGISSEYEVTTFQCSVLSIVVSYQKKRACSTRSFALWPSSSFFFRCAHVRT